MFKNTYKKHFSIAIFATLVWFNPLWAADGDKEGETKVAFVPMKSVNGDKEKSKDADLSSPNSLTLQERGHSLKEIDKVLKEYAETYIGIQDGLLKASYAPLRRCVDKHQKGYAGKLSFTSKILKLFAGAGGLGSVIASIYDAVKTDDTAWISAVLSGISTACVAIDPICQYYSEYYAKAPEALKLFVDSLTDKIYESVKNNNTIKPADREIITGNKQLLHSYVETELQKTTYEKRGSKCPSCCETSSKRQRIN